MSKRNGKDTWQRLVAYWESGKSKRHPKEQKWPGPKATELERVKAVAELLSMTSYLLMVSSTTSLYPDEAWTTGLLAFGPAFNDLERRLSSLQIVVSGYIQALEQDEQPEAKRTRRRK